MDSEDLWILKLTKKSAKLTLLIAVLFTADNILPTSSLDEQCIEFIFEEGELIKAKTGSRTFTLAQEHIHPRQLGNGFLRLTVSPIMRHVKSYSLKSEGHLTEYFPFFSVYQYVYLMYLVLVFSALQLVAPLTSLPRFGLWIFSMACILSYLVIYVSSTY